MELLASGVGVSPGGKRCARYRMTMNERYGDQFPEPRFAIAFCLRIAAPEREFNHNRHGYSGRERPT
jgi:hypothetical protein